MEKQKQNKFEREIFTNGYSDGSGKGTIVLKIGKEETGILRTHWGCSCCDTETSEENNKVADKIVKLFNSKKFKLNSEGKFFSSQP